MHSQIRCLGSPSSYLSRNQMELVFILGQVTQPLLASVPGVNGNKSAYLIRMLLSLKVIGRYIESKT